MANLAKTLAALAVAVAAASPAWAQNAPAGGPAAAETIDISLSDYAFAPTALSLKAGTAYHLHFINAGSKDHDFTAPQFFAAAQIAPADQAKVKRGTVAIDKGQEMDVTITPSAGDYKVTCTHFMHEMMGMHGTITVQ